MPRPGQFPRVKTVFPCLNAEQRGGGDELSFMHRMAMHGHNAAMKASALLLSCLALSAAGAARAEVHEALNYDHYEAHATPGRPLTSALYYASPFRTGGEVYHSATAWYLDWKVRPEPTVDGRCRVGEVLVELHGKMTLPRLVGGSREQEQRFDAYLVRLREHELGHYEIGREAARVLEKQFYALKPAPSCGKLQSEARDAGARLLPRFEALGDSYDVHTQHGKTQGAWLTD
jgi:predicted secreted Zn-dependent protease